MREQVLTDQLWKRLKPLIPTPARRYRFPGRRRVDNRAALEGILFVVRTGIRWNDLPTSAFGVSGANLLAAVEGMARSRRVAAAARDPAS
jgi:transposase